MPGTDFSRAGVPQELKDRPQWVCWREAERNGKKTKIPMQPDGSGAAKANDMATWGSFDEAVETAEAEGWGIGYVFSGAGPYCGVDLDGCLASPTSPADWLPALDPFIGETFIERSPSGTGLHIIIKDSDVPEWWRNQKRGEGGDEHGVEVYDQGRYFTFTGDAIEESTEGVGGGIDLEDWLEDAWLVFNDELPSAEPDMGSFASGDSRDTDVDLRVSDVIPASQYTPEENHAHPFHGSSTGTNFRVDDNDETWRCWRHDVTGNAHHLLGIKLGIIECGDWRRGGLDSDTWRDIYDAARTQGYDIPEPSGGGESPQRDPVQPDGGATAADTPQTGTVYESLRERVRDRVNIPLDPDAYGEDREKIKHDTAIDRFCHIITDEYHFVRPRADTRGWRDTLYVYEEDSGVYEAHGEWFIESEAERLLGDFATNERVNQIVGKVERNARVPGKWLETDPDRLVVGNGILDLHTGELDDHTPEEYHKTSIDVDYRPDAECPRIDEFFHDIVDDSDVPTLYRLVAHSIYREYAAEKAAMLLGEGQNGKSVFIDLLERFLGQYNVANQSLQKLNMDDWAANNLVGKLANFHPDLSDQSVKTMQMFKKLTGRDTIDADVKFEKPVKFENYATLIFACNRMPVLEDDTRGNWRRWILIQFPNTFEQGDDDYKEKRELMAELTQDSELEGLLAQAVEEIQAWADGRRWFPNAPGWRETRRQIRRAAEPVYDFAHTCLQESKDDDAYITKDAARQCYREYASVEGLPPIERSKFGEKLLNQTDIALSSAQKRVNGTRRHCYTGVEFTARAKQLLEDGGPEVADSQASLDGGPQERAAFVVRYVKKHSGGQKDRVERNDLLEACSQDGMSFKEAEAAIEKAAAQGDIVRTPDGEEFYA